MKLQDTLQKGKGNGQRKAYNHLVASGVFGVAEKIAEYRKSNKRTNKRNRR